MPNKKIVIAVEAKMDKATADLKKLEKELKKFQRVAGYDSATGKYTKGLKRLSSQSKRTTSSLITLGKHLARLTAIYGTFTGVKESISNHSKFRTSTQKPKYHYWSYHRADGGAKAKSTRVR